MSCYSFLLFVSVMRIMLWLQLPRKPRPKKKWWHVRDCYGFLHISRPFHMNITRFKSYLMAWIKKLCLYSPVSGTVSYLNRKNVMFHFFFEKALFSSIADGHNVRSARKPSRSRISLSFWWKDGCLVHTLLLKYLHVMTAAHHSIQKSTATPSIFIFKDSLFGWHIKRWNCFCMSDRTVFYQRECYVSVRSNTSPLLIRLFLFKKDSQFGRLSSLHIAPPADARRRRRRRNQRGNKTVLRVLPNPYGIIIPVEVPPQCVLRIFPFLKKEA